MPPDTSLALQDICPMQAIEIVDDCKNVPPPALQGLLLYQPAVLIGFIGTVKLRMAPRFGRIGG
jgi:hypothetical protein